jgi:hypothetical protein
VKVPDGVPLEVPVRAVQVKFRNDVAAAEVPDPSCVGVPDAARACTVASQLRSPALLSLYTHILLMLCVPSLSRGVQFCTRGKHAAAPVLVRWSGGLSSSRCRHALPAAACVVQTLATDAPIPRLDSVCDPSAPARSGEDFVTMTLPSRGIARRADAAKAWRRAI